MEINNFLKFLILWVTLSQGYAFSSNNRTADSLDHLVRTKRVIDRTPNANTRVRLRDAYYVVTIKKNGMEVCAGTILAAQIILTTEACIQEHARYTVISGTLSTIRGGTSHLVTGMLWHPIHEFNFMAHEIALLKINPPITFGENKNRPIPIFQSNTGQLPANTIVSVSGFGFTYHNSRGGIGCISAGTGQRRFILPYEVRTIHLPTISLQDCQARTNDHIHVTDENICTFHQQKSCSPGERGNPLVYNDHLVGIMVLDGFQSGADVYLNVALPAKRNWILSHMSPEHIPQYIPPPEEVRQLPHRHNDPQECSRVHPCNDENDAH